MRIYSILAYLCKPYPKGIIFRNATLDVVVKWLNSRQRRQKVMKFRWTCRKPPMKQIVSQSSHVNLAHLPTYVMISYPGYPCSYFSAIVPCGLIKAASGTGRFVRLNSVSDPVCAWLRSRTVTLVQENLPTRHTWKEMRTCEWWIAYQGFHLE